MLAHVSMGSDHQHLPIHGFEYIKSGCLVDLLLRADLLEDGVGSCFLGDGAGTGISLGTSRGPSAVAFVCGLSEGGVS